MEIEFYMAKPDKTIGEHNQELYNCLDEITQLGYITDKRILNLIRYACKYHDYGKAIKPFQTRVTSIDKKLKFDPVKEVAHNVLSIFFINKDDFENEADYLTVLYAVAYHHNYCNVAEELTNRIALINSLLEELPVYNLRPARIMMKIKNIRTNTDAIIIKGMLQRCDHCASGGFHVELKNDFLSSALQRLLEEWQEENKLKKEVKWNELQQYCQTKSDNNIIAIAPTGMGKTEAALLWLGDTKGFFVLPLRTAINTMYDRIRINILKDEKIQERLGLLHSSSVDYLLDKLQLENTEMEMYTTTAKRLSMPLTITTMDQLFDFVFQAAGYELKLATFSYSKFIIDEIQMYNAELLAYLIYGLERIIKVGGKVAIITATLAPFICDKLQNKINYEYRIFHSDLKRHVVKVCESKLQVNDIVEVYSTNKNEKKRNKILVICNTIKKAQEIYRELSKFSDVILEDELHLLHSRYTRKDREERENEIKNFAGSSKELGEAKNGIWISTSLVEASLDLDFDYLFTELQDLNSLFQRMGRCNRLGLKELNEPNCYVYTEIEAGLLGDFIDETIYEISRTELLKFASQRNCSCMLEDDKIEMLNCFTMEAVGESKYMRDFDEAYHMLESLRGTVINDIDNVHQLRHILTVDIIPYSVYKKNYDDIQFNLEQLSKLKYSDMNRIKYIHSIKQYVVSVPGYIYHSYIKKLQSGKAINWGIVKISDFEKIWIVGCKYSKLGFESLEDSDVEDPMIW